MRTPFRLQFKVQSSFQYLPFLTRLLPMRSAQILVEAFNNAVLHAHRRKKEKWVTLDIQKSRRKIILRVWDEGGGLPKKKFSSPSRWATHGRGLALMGALADRIRFRKTKHGHYLEAVCFYDAKCA